MLCQKFIQTGAEWGHHVDFVPLTIYKPKCIHTLAAVIMKYI